MQRTRKSSNAPIESKVECSSATKYPYMKCYLLYTICFLLPFLTDIRAERGTLVSRKMEATRDVNSYDATIRTLQNQKESIENELRHCTGAGQTRNNTTIQQLFFKISKEIVPPEDRTTVPIL